MSNSFQLQSWNLIRIRVWILLDWWISPRCCFNIVHFNVLVSKLIFHENHLLSLCADGLNLQVSSIHNITDFILTSFLMRVRIQALLKWVSDSARVAAMKKSGRVNHYVCPSRSTREYGLLMPSPSHLHCVAAILWHSYELFVEYDLPALLNRELFE